MSLKILYKNKIYNGKRFINKIFVAYLIGILSIGTIIPIIRSDPGDSWWDPGWNYRKLLTMDMTKISGTLVNFPILVQMTDSDLASYAQSTGNDIVFVLYSDNTTKLNHELEYYNGATGALYAWVNITRLSSSTNTKIWMYYGNPGCSSQQNKYGTWNSKYKAVYHLDENGLPFVDSTSNKNNITSANVNGTGMAQTGGIYKWLHFNGTTNYLVVPFTLTGTYTVEAMANPDQITASGVVYSNEKTTAPVTGIAMGISSAGVYVTDGTLHRGLSPSSTYTPAKTTKWWADVVFAVGSKIWFYLDGVNRTLTSQSYFTNYANYHAIGARYNGKYSAFWDGFIDEVRISSGPWNASWLKTCYEIQKDPASFCSRGDQESAPSGGNQPPVFGTPVPSDGSINNPLSFTWSIPISDPEGDQFSWTIQCNNGQTNSATGAANGTKSLSLSGLEYSTTYKVWVNATDPAGSGLYIRRWFTFTTQGSGNSPPVFGTPSPVNDSTGNLLSLTWSIPINDPNGELFSWAIQCSNGQVNSGTSESNGTKSLALSGLTYLTTYKVWVNATDPTGSGLYTRKWYIFTTQAGTSSWWDPGWNYRKLLTMDMTKISGTLVNFPILVQMTDSDLASYAQSTGNDIVFVLYSDNTTKLNHELEYYNGATGALYAWVNITRLSSSTNTKIWMYYGNPGCSSQQNKYGTWNSKYKAVYHLDENGLPFVDSTSNKNNITSANVNGTGMAQTGGIYKWLHFNGTTNYLVVPFTLTGTYTVEAMANPDQITASGVVYSNEKTTAPVTGIAMGISSAGVYVTDGTLHRGLSPSSTYTPAKTTKWWADVVFAVGSKIWFYLDGVNRTLTSQSYFTNYANYHAIGARYNGKYSAFWDGFIDEVRISSGPWNASWLKTCYEIQKDPASFCSRGDQESAPSGGNQPPVFGTPVPSDGSINNPLSFTWSIPISDPEGDQFSWTIQCNNGQTNSATGAANGTKSLSLSGLEYSTTYKVWVNATDPSGSSVYTRSWYTFSTIVNLPPVFGSTTPSNGSTNNLLSFSWSIPINDPDGNPFLWTIQCSNGQTNSGSGASNGTKSLALSGLAYLTTYKVWVNATDPTGSGLYTRRWFTFTTKPSNSPPVFGAPSPVNGSSGNLLSLTWSISINDPEGNVFSWSIQCSNGQVSSGSGASNGTKSLALSGLAYLTTYKVWVNATDPTGSGLYTRRWFTFTTKPSNSPPVFGAPSPVNGSSGNLLSLTWSISINDPEGNVFSWSIQCSNGQVSSGSGASNGTKSLALSGLAYLTTYKVWVNATDPTGSGLYTRRWFTFTTKPSNSPPVFGTPSPVNDSTGNWLGVPPAGSWIPWNIPINDPEGNRFSWTIQCSNGQTNSGTSPFNGTEYIALSTLSYSTTYKVWVNATDPTGSELYTRRWYTFTTRRSGNNPPVFTRVPSPENGSISKGNQLSPSWMNLTWSIRINDLENNSFNWWIQCSNGQVNSSTGAKNGTKSLKLSYLAYSTTYKIWVNATDPTGSGLYIRRWFTFTTKANDPPILGTTSHVNGSIGNSLSYGWWGIFIYDLEGNPFSWTIQCSNGQGTSGVGASNGTKTLSLSGLAYSTSYKVWVNATDLTGSGLYTRSWYTFTTQASGGNNPPVFSMPSPVNSSSGSRLSLSWSIQINDSDGTVFSWTIQCSNGQGTSGVGASNGTKTLSLSGLAYSTSYKVWVNATDPTGSNLYTRKWYTFTTEPIIPISIPTPKTWSPVTSAAGETRVGAAVADVNDDGRMEIIRSGINGIVVYNGTTGAVIWNKLTTMWDSHIPLEIIDLNNDGYLDVISSYSTGTRALSGEDGSQLWYNANAPLYNKHAVTGDINGDGYPEVFVCTAGANSGSPQGWVTALTHDGQIFAKVHTYFPCYGGLSLGDTNNDGVYELFMGERSIGYDGNVVGKGVRAFWASNLTERWCHPEMLSSSNCPTLVDTNKDGILEVVSLAQTGGNGIAVYNSADGSVIHYSNIPGLRCHSNPTVYDIDGDGNLEIIVGGGSDAWGKPVVWDLYTWSLEAWLPFNCWEPPAIADINGDGRVEILECTITNISIFDDNYVFRGSIPLNNNRSGSGYYGMSMIVAQDIDKDNLLELVINRYNQVYVYDTNGAAPTPRALSQFSYYSQHRGRSPYFTQY